MPNPCGRVVHASSELKRVKEPTSGRVSTRCDFPSRETTHPPIRRGNTGRASQRGSRRRHHRFRAVGVLPARCDHDRRAPGAEPVQGRVGRGRPAHVRGRGDGLLVAGRPRSGSRDLPYRDAGRAARQFPEYDRPGRFAATNPDDDEAFLRQVRERAEQQTRAAREGPARPARRGQARTAKAGSGDRITSETDRAPSPTPGPRDAGAGRFVRTSSRPQLARPRPVLQSRRA